MLASSTMATLPSSYSAPSIDFWSMESSRRGSYSLSGMAGFLCENKKEKKKKKNKKNDNQWHKSGTKMILQCYFTDSKMLF